MKIFAIHTKVNGKSIRINSTSWKDAERKLCDFKKTGEMPLTAIVAGELVYQQIAEEYTARNVLNFTKSKYETDYE